MNPCNRRYVGIFTALLTAVLLLSGCATTGINKGQINIVGSVFDRRIDLDPENRLPLRIDGIDNSFVT